MNSIGGLKHLNDADVCPRHISDNNHGDKAGLSQTELQLLEKTVGQSGIAPFETGKNAKLAESVMERVNSKWMTP